MTTAGTAPTPAARSRAAPRELAILGGFVVIVGIAIATVLLPALRDDAPDEDEQTHPVTATGSGAAAQQGAARTAVPAAH